MTFRDEFKNAGRKAFEAGDDTSPSVDDDVARLLRALTEDLQADSEKANADDPIPEDEDEGEEAGGDRHLPLGKIALALVAAGGIGFAVVMFDGSKPDTPPQATVQTTGQTATVTPPTPAPLPPANAKPVGDAQPETLIARAPAPVPAPASAPIPAVSQTPPASPVVHGEPAPGRPLPSVPGATQTVVKPLESSPQKGAAPPFKAETLKAESLPIKADPSPKLDAPPAKPAEDKPTESKQAEIKPAETRAPEAPKPADTKVPDTKPAEAPPATAAKPEANATELQAMLSPKSPPPGPRAQKPSPPSPTPANHPTTPPSAHRTSVSGNWVVQAGSFSVAENAEAVRSRLASRGYTAQVLDWDDDRQRHWKVVRVGDPTSQTEARRIASELSSSLGVHALVISVR